MIWRTLSLAGLLMLLVGCASKPVPSHTYLLRPPPAAVQTEPATATVALEPVVMAAYLEPRGIALEVDNAEIRPARNHRWAEPLGESVRRYLQVSIAAESGQGVAAAMINRDTVEKRVRVAVHRLHATISGEAILVAEWTILDEESGVTMAQRNHTRQITLSAAGYPGIVQAHETLLTGLAAEIGASLRGAE